jgi:ATP-binding cassette subfamily F protein 3
LKKEMQMAQKTIERITGEIAKLDKLLADPTLYEGDAARAQAVNIERGQHTKRLAEAEEAWLLASEAYERAAHESSSAQEI